MTFIMKCALNVVVVMCTFMILCPHVVIQTTTTTTKTNSTHEIVMPRSMDLWTRDEVARIGNYGDAVTEVIHTANIYHSDRELIDE